jgi:beta-lactamase regulating signal transducer with metallopeptidase domain
MNSLIETLNEWGGRFLDFAWPMAWQTALLITALLAFDFLFRRRVRASVRYALWLVVLVKLIVPPTLALPTSPAWWLHTNASLTPITPRIQNYSVTYDPASLPPASNPLPAFIPPAPAMTLTAWLLVLSVVVSAVLLVWLLVRWWQITRQVSAARTSERLTAIMAKTQSLAGIRSQPPVKLTGNTMSPAVCGLFRPAILIPQALAEQFSDEQLRAVLLHELIHLRRRDVWLNFVQSLLQIVYWWHPLVWLANARIRRVREEAVDDAVMLALAGEAEAYAPTLLEVAKLALNRPLASLGLVGILESRSALRQRIERLVDFRAPRRAGLTLASVFGVLAFTAVAVPMGGAPDSGQPPSSPVPVVSAVASNNITNAPARRFKVSTFRLFKSVSNEELEKQLAAAGIKSPPTTYFYRATGLLFVEGPADQLALADRLILKMNGFSPERIDTLNSEFVKNLPDLPDKNATATNLFERTFKLDAFFLANFRDIMVPGTKDAFLDGRASSSEISKKFRDLFRTLGVNLESPKGKAIFYNDKRGILFVIATENDLYVIEHALQAIKEQSTQVHIKARFIEVPKGTLETLADLKKIIAIPHQPNQSTGLVGILTSENLRTALQSVERLKGAEELAEPEAVTLGGRQTQMRATELITVVTNFSLQETGTNTAIVPQTGQMEVGPILDTVPYVLSDGYTINLTAIPSVTEFMGYGSPTNTKTAFASSGEKVDLPVISPIFDTYQAVASFNLWDNQTVVMKGLISSGAESQRNKATNFFGHPFAAKNEPGKELIVFITATIVDAAGNRVHSEADMPFARTEIPSQPPQN